MVSIYLLHFPLFGGIVTVSYPYSVGAIDVGGLDAGDHVRHVKLFSESNPGVYQGFTSFFGVIYWLEKTGLDAYQSFVVGFLLCVIFLLGECAVAAEVFLDGFTGLLAKSEDRVERLRGTGRLLSLLLGVFPISFILLPLVHYLQADGFYPQLYGLLPLFGFWISLCLVNSLPALFGYMGICVVLYRYTYGLNLGDLFVACGVMFFVWAIAQTKYRAVSIGLGLGSILLAVNCYSRLLPVIAMAGAVLEPDLVSLVSGIFLLVLAISFIGYCLWPLLRPSLQLFVIFPVIFGLAGSGIITCYVLLIAPPSYYVYKYAFHAVVLLSVSMVIVFSGLVLCLLQRVQFRSSVLSLFGFFLALLGFWQVSSSLEKYRVTFAERAFNKTNPEHLLPLIDRQAWKIMENALQEHQAVFKGYLTPDWATSNFMNSALGDFGDKQLYFFRDIVLEPGSCIFIQNGKNNVERYIQQEPLLEARLRELLENPMLTSTYYESQEGRGLQKLSVLCHP